MRRDYFFDLEMKLSTEVSRGISLDASRNHVFIRMSKDAATRLTVLTGLTGKALENKVKNWILNKIPDNISVIYD